VSRPLTLSPSHSPNSPRSLTPETQQLAEHLQSLLLLRRGYNLAARLLIGHRSARQSKFIVCAFTPYSSVDFSPPFYIYSFDAAQQESIKLYQSHEQRRDTPFYTVCSYGLQDLYPTRGDSLLSPAPRITKYNGGVEPLPNRAEDLRVDMGCDIFLNRQPLPVVQFDLAREFSVSSVRGEQGDSIPFIQEPGESAVTLIAPVASPLDTLRLLFAYEGRGLQTTASGDLYLTDPIYWLPRLGYLRRAAHKIMVKHSLDKRVAGIGKAPPAHGDHNTLLTAFDSGIPARAFTFALGNFVHDSLQAENLKLHVHSTPEHRAAARRSLLEDVSASLHFFENRLGKYPFPYLDILEAPGAGSQGLPGLLMFSRAGFLSDRGEIRQMLCAHEVAHQWLGNAIGWATYHDQWLAEGIAEYLGAMFMQAMAPQEKYFERQLERWRDDLLRDRFSPSGAELKHLALGRGAAEKSEGRAAGPIWMGVRLGEKHAGDYYLQTYEKGAWVIHMLRRMLTDDATGSDEKFWKMLADFYASHSGKDPTTYDFQRIVERHAGMPMDWFFQQWVLRTEIPNYEWNVRIERAGENDFLAHGVIKQKATSPDFRMPVPIAFEFGNDKRRVERVWVTGSETAFEFRLSQKPKIIFNYEMAVLCEEKKTD
jgi:hypothetical protein